MKLQARMMVGKYFTLIVHVYNKHLDPFEVSLGRPHSSKHSCLQIAGLEFLAE